MSESIKLTIDGIEIMANQDQTILEAARIHGIEIPSLCYLKEVNQIGACRICVVEVAGQAKLMASCVTKVSEGMEVKTNSLKVRSVRQHLYELILSDHEQNCLACERNGTCELQELGERIHIPESNPYQGQKARIDFSDRTNPSIIRDMDKCILCRRCEAVCETIQGIGALTAQNRGFESYIGPTSGLDLKDINCTYCGQCTTVCPVGALKEVDGIEATYHLLQNPNYHVIVQTAPAVRAALGEVFGMAPGSLVTGKMVAALRRLGFDDVFDTNFAADLTILEEGTELLSRLESALNGGQGLLPMITSCSPGWINYIEQYNPTLLGHLSSCKSPHMMLGALAKTYYADLLDRPSDTIKVVSVMPCTAKKYEITREEMKGEVDVVLTTRELGRMIKEAGLAFTLLEDEVFDQPMGLSTGAADIFGTSGGVMEAALRTVYELVTGTSLPSDRLHVESMMGLEGLKEGQLTIENPLEPYAYLDGVTLRFAAASGLANAKYLMEELKLGTSSYHFIEVMACPGGCISGGGQPRMTNQAVRQKRMEAIYKEDEGKPIRKSHENPAIQKLYETYLQAPLSDMSHHLLHTHYSSKNKYNLKEK